MTTPIETVARDYDALAPEYARRLGDELAGKPFDRAWLGRFARRMTGPVGDIGCGPGQATAFLAAQDATAIGLDLSPGMVAEARRAHPGLAFEVADFRDLGARPGRFAGLVAMYAFVHASDAELAAALEACHAALGPGGELLVASHLGEGVLRPGEMWGIPVDLAFRLFAPGALDAALARAGFTVVESAARLPIPEVEYPSCRAYLRAVR